MSAGIRDDRTRSVMTRIKGVHVLALGIVLWGVAVWLLGTPHPAETETTAETASDEAPPAGHAVDAGSVAERAAGIDTERAAVAPASAIASSAPSPDGSSASQPDREVRGASAPTALAPAGKPDAASSPSGSEPSPAAVGGMQLATAPSQRESDVAAPTTGIPQEPLRRESTAGPAAGASTASRYADGGSLQGNAAPAGVPLATVQPFRQFEYPMPPTQPPARTGSQASGDSVVASELNSARRAAWEGRLAEALAHYRAAARIQPDSHVIWGEMGNVLWAMQRWPEAAYALEGAATLLVAAGELHAASTLVPAVGLIDPEAAQRCSSASGTPPSAIPDRPPRPPVPHESRARIGVARPCPKVARERTGRTWRVEAREARGPRRDSRVERERPQ